ncbi:MAG: Gfo/Idh/MocA family oxidoreductase [bacterium]|nr:Gfo/Idh/MocA family oxidoreductase [bacterium]
MTKTYRAALIGCGRMGATIDDEVRDHPLSYLWLPYSHAAAVVACDRTELVAVSDVDGEKAEAIRQRYEVPVCYADYKEMIKKEALDIVCIATRPATHAEMVVFAAENGVKGIYCEKPLCCSMAEADAMVAAVEKHGVKFNYGTQRRYTGLYHTMRKLADAGEIGNVQAVIVQQGVTAALWGLTHGADMMLYLAGDAEIEFVQGCLVCKDEDWDGNRLNVDPGVASGYVRFANGVHGYTTAGSGPEFELCGSTGKLRTHDNGYSCSFRKAGEVKGLTEEQAFPEFARESGTVNGVRDIAEALDTGRETQGPIRLASRSQEMVMGIIESHRLGGARVSLPMENRELYVGRENW